MAYSYNDFGPKKPGDTITVDFTYESREDIEVLVDGVLVEDTLWEWANDGLLLCKAGFPLGATGRVRRITDIADLSGRLVGTAVLDYPTINSNFDRLLFRLQEQDDGEADREARVVAIGDTLEKQADALAASVELGRRWAEEAEDVEVVPGHYSALHHSQKSLAAAALAGNHRYAADAARLGAENAQSYAEGAAGSAQDAMDKAYRWAEEVEDVEVVPGHYSALHWAKKALGVVVGGLASWINEAGEKTTPADNDRFPLTDSADSYSVKRTTWANIKAALSSVFLPLTGGTVTGNIRLNGGVGIGRDAPAVGGLYIHRASGNPFIVFSDDDGSTGTPADLAQIRAERGNNVFRLATHGLQDLVSFNLTTRLGTVAGDPTAALGIATQQYVDARPSVGVGQTWQNVSGSRTHNTTYQNTTGRAIQLSITTTAISQDFDFQVSADGLTWLNAQRIGGIYVNHIAHVIPNGWYYRLAISTETGITYWLELR